MSNVCIWDVPVMTAMVSFAAQTCAMPLCMNKSTYKVFILSSVKVAACIATTIWMALTNYSVWSQFPSNSLGLAALVCHDSSPCPPCPSKASPPPPMAWPISDAFRSTSDLTALSVCFSFSLMDSHMFLLSFFSWYSQFSLFTFWPLTFVPDFGLVYPTFGLHLWQLYTVAQKTVPMFGCFEVNGSYHNNHVT